MGRHRSIGQKTVVRWLAPPVALDAPTRGVVVSLAAIAVVLGYMGTLVSATITFAAKEFRIDTGTQGVALAVIRADVVLTFPLVVLSDRLGRRRVLGFAALLGIAGSALCSLAPSLTVLVALQIPARGFVTASAIIVNVLLAEGVPAGARAWASGVMVAGAAVGSGLTVALLPLADLDERAWRLLFVAALAGAPVVAMALRGLPESARFERARRTPATGTPITSRRALLVAHRRRLAVLGAGLFLLTLFANPARQFQNDFLRRERGFSGAGIAVFSLLTNAPATIGLLLGGRMADTRGRRRIVAGGLIAASVFQIAAMNGHGSALWTWSIITAFFAALVLPSLNAYGPELFPTGLRGVANGLLNAASRLGGALGLLLAGWLGRDHHLGRAISWLAVTPIAAALLVLWFYPETARRELEDLNPGDRRLDDDDDRGEGFGSADSHDTTAAATSRSLRPSE